MSEEKPLLGLWSSVGTYALLVIFAFNYGSIGIVLSEMGMLLTGSVHQISQEQASLLVMVPIVIAVVALELPATIAAAIFQGALLGKSGTHSVSEMFKGMTEGNHFFKFFILVLAEELFARWLFLGLLTQIPFLSGTFAFYVLFLLGNGIWALVHLKNFSNENDRHWLRVLPQFVAGIFFTYIYVKYGLLAVVLTHFASNAIIFAFHKIRQVKSSDALTMIYLAVCTFVSFLLMDKPLADVLVWFVSEPVFELPSWDFWDYVIFSVFISSIFGLMTSLLLYDRDEVKNKQIHFSPLAHVIFIPLTVAVMYGLYILLGYVISDVPYRILALAILLAFLHQGTSGSAVARTFWLGLPSVYFSICILHALGWWPSMAWLAISTIVHMPKKVIETYEQ